MTTLSEGDDHTSFHTRLRFPRQWHWKDQSIVYRPFNLGSFLHRTRPLPYYAGDAE